jgi:2-phosphosulfolactate phosphatase
LHGFDFGNSPFSYTKEKVAGKTIVLTTTNGTHALHLSRKAKKIIIGAFINLTAVCNWLKHAGSKRTAGMLGLEKQL